MRRTAAIVIAFASLISIVFLPATKPEVPRKAQVSSEKWYGSDDELDGVQVPVPMKDRVFNATGTQCVWCSLELLGRWAEEPKLVGLTKQRDCQSYSSASM